MACGVVLPLAYALYGDPAFFVSRVAPWLDVRSPAALDLYSQYYRFAVVFLLFFVIPLCVARLLGMSPGDIGLRAGDARWSFRVLVPVLAACVPLLYLSAADPSFQAEYPMARSAAASTWSFVVYEASYLLYYVGWEVFFRGFLLFGLERGLGRFGSNLFQTVPSALLHMVKPAGEAWASVVAGPLFGAAAFKAGSVLYVLGFHYAVGVLNDVFCALRAGLFGG